LAGRRGCDGLDVAAFDRAILRAGFEIVETGAYPAMPVNRFVVARKPGG
jgi:hypothetical protein